MSPRLGFRVKNIKVAGAGVDRGGRMLRREVRAPWLARRDRLHLPNVTCAALTLALGRLREQEQLSLGGLR